MFGVTKKFNANLLEALQNKFMILKQEPHEELASTTSADILKGMKVLFGNS